MLLLLKTTGCTRLNKTHTHDHRQATTTSWHTPASAQPRGWCRCCLHKQAMVRNKPNVTSSCERVAAAVKGQDMQPWLGRTTPGRPQPMTDGCHDPCKPNLTLIKAGSPLGAKTTGHQASVLSCTSRLLACHVLPSTSTTETPCNMHQASTATIPCHKYSLRTSCAEQSAGRPAAGELYCCQVQPGRQCCHHNYLPTACNHGMYAV